MSRLGATDEELTYYVVDDRRAIRSPWGKGNSKIGRGIYTYSRIPVTTCPGATKLCKEVCYSKRMVDNELVWDWMVDNTARFHDVPPLPSDAKIVRIHVSGDFDTKEYIDAWELLVVNRPSVDFFTYTRSWRVPELLPSLKALQRLPNMQLFASMDESTKESPPDGWRVAWLGTGPRTPYRCPEENGTLPNCEVCGYCFRAKKGDVLFSIHGELDVALEPRV